MEKPTSPTHSFRTKHKTDIGELLWWITKTQRDISSLSTLGCKFMILSFYNRFICAVSADSAMDSPLFYHHHSLCICRREFLPFFHFGWFISHGISYYRKYFEEKIAKGFHMHYMHRVFHARTYAQSKDCECTILIECGQFQTGRYTIVIFSKRTNAWLSNWT